MEMKLKHVKSQVLQMIYGDAAVLKVPLTCYLDNEEGKIGTCEDNLA